MLFRTYRLAAIVSLSVEIINSALVVGLYYGFLTAFSIGPSYLLLLRAHALEEGTEKKVSATTGLITGQLMVFISIYYAPLHLALGRPHTITVLALPYLLFHFFRWNNDKEDEKNFFAYRSTIRNSMRNLSTQSLFLNHLIFQLFNHFFSTSSVLARLVNIYMFRCNNKMLFVTSSFVGWLIGHILFMQWVGLVLVWIRPGRLVRLNVLIRSKKYLPSQFKSFMSDFTYLMLNLINDPGRIYSILLFIICTFSSGRMPVLLLTKKPKAPFHLQLKRKTKEGGESQEERDVEIERASEKNQEIFGGDFVEKLPVNLLFNCQEWTRPFRYVKNNQVEGGVKSETSEYFFVTCESDGKLRISFASLPSLSTFWKMIQRKIDAFTPQKPPKTSNEELYNYWIYTKNKKKITEKKKFLNRIKALDKGFIFLDILEKRTRLYNDTIEKNKNLRKSYGPFFNEKTLKNKNYVPKMHEPLLTGPYRARIARGISLWRTPRTDSTSLVVKKKKNRIHRFLWNTLFRVGTKYSYSKKKYDKNNQKRKKIGVIQIHKSIPEWKSKLINDLEFALRDYEASAWKKVDTDIRSRTLKQILLFSQQSLLPDPSLPDEVLVAQYLDEPDFRRNIIKGSGRAQRRKTIAKQVLPRPSSPLFWGKTQSKLEVMLKQLFFRNLKRRKKIIDPKAKNEKRKRKREERMRIETEEAWENLSHGPQIRTSLLVMQSILRKYILFPLFIIAKNTVHFLSDRVSDWDEDFAEWDKEIHIPCTHSGVPLRENELLTYFLEEGFDIKIISPFSLKPWCRSKLQASGRNLTKKKKSKKLELGFCYLTVWGMEADEAFGSPRTRDASSSPFIAFLKPVLKKLEKKTKKKTKKVLTVFKKVVRKLSKGNEITLDKLKRLSKSSKTKDESFTQIGSIDWANYSHTELQMKNLTDTTSIMRNEIERLEKDKIKVISEIKSSINSNVELESQPPKNNWKILIRRNIRLIIKLHYFIKIFIEKKYIDIFLPIINIARINTKHFVDSMIGKYISNNERNESKNETTEKDINFISISTIKKSRPTKKNSHIFYDLSSLSQGYVFFKLSQPQVINLSKLRSALQYHGTSFFIKTTIKNSFGIQGIFNAQLRHKKLRSYDQWKNWLRGHFQYNSPIEWSRLIPQKWRNRVNQRWTAKNKDLKKWSSYEKDLLFSFHSTNQNCYEIYSQQEKFLKSYRYGLLSYQFLNYETKKDSSIYGPPLQVNKKKNKNLFYTIDKFVYEDMNMGLKNNKAFVLSLYLRRMNVIDMEKRLNRKYFDWKKKILRQNNNDIEKEPLYIRIQKDPEDIESTPPNSEEIFVDWLKIDKMPMKSPPKGDWEFWFFTEFVLLYKAYKVKPWTIPSQLLVLTVHLSNPLYNYQRMREIDSKNRVNTRLVLGGFLKEFLAFQVHWYNKVVAQRTLDMFVPFSYLMEEGKALKKVVNSVIISLGTKRIGPNHTRVSNKRWMTKRLQFGIMFLDPICLPRRINRYFITYQTISISLVHKSKQQIKQQIKKRYRDERSYFHHNNFDESTPRHQRITGNREQNYYDLLIPENILSSRHRRELRILISFNLKKRSLKKTNVVDRNPVFCNKTKIRNCGPFLKKSKHRDRDKNELIKLKFFLWPNYRLEDLACMNRYWFDTNNGSRFSMLRIYMYPRLKIG
uniref:photosystem I assembly protein Ycf1 n=1 Tax=Dipelta yunnanensis TaxID=180069 RepID=UPI0010C30405|nr:photosystem I assembly protein Ycf1 [Dipelta yunnanensis]QBR54586.1 photosystem I assembly protein Ycf1 [Dipelta yunnanensis]